MLPKERLNEVASFVRGGLQDLSISRTTFDWGVPVPGNPKHVMYVWVDALTNYITAVGYPDTDSEKFRKYWPADLHVIGKDIVRFHAVYWPAFLMSAGIAVPRHIFSHGFLFNRGEKMSKSVGNVIDPFALADAYGVDPLRYFLLREVPFGQDGNYSHEAIVNRINADLANDLGNLAQRSLTMVARQFRRRAAEAGRAFSANDQAILAAADAMIGKAREAMATQQLHQVLNAVWAVVADANRYFAGEAPWALAKTDPARQGTVLYVTAEVLRQIAILAQPFMPASAAKTARSAWRCPAAERDFAFLGGKHRIAAGAKLPAPAPVFPRYVEPATRRRNSHAEKICLIDSHCHLDFPDFADELDAVVARARDAGIARMVTISTRVARHAQVLAIAERFADVYCSVGTHPHYAHEELDVTAADLVARTRHPKGGGARRGRPRLPLRQLAARCAGARFSHPHRGGARDRAAAGHPFARSRRRHRAHPRRGNRAGRLPCRAALLHRRPRTRPRAPSRSGYFISFTGILTFKNSTELRAIAAELPADRILVETDAPYLAPGPISRQAQRAGLCGRDRESAGGNARRVVRRRSRGRRRTISFGCSTKCRGRPARAFALAQ